MARRLEDKHLTSAIAAIKRGNNYYLVFEWADGGSLQQFWENHGKPELNAKLVEEVLDQLHGLSGALDRLHGSGRSASPTSTLNNHDSDSNDSKNDDFVTDESGHWRHGDLKPDNILRFKCSDGSTRLGTLQIADLGLAKRHTVATTNRKGPTGTRYGTLKYEGPEAHPTNAKLRARTRRYDVWSMGCIILEFIIWLLYGKEGLRKFNDQTMDPTLLDDGPQEEFEGSNFYMIKNRQFVVNDIAKYWMRMIRERDPEFSSGSPSALQDLLDIVENKLLIIKSDEGDRNGNLATNNENGSRESVCRAKASDLEISLKELKSKGERDGRYLFTGRPRGNVVIPSKARTTTGQYLAVADRGAVDQPLPSQDGPLYQERSIAVPERSDLNTTYTHVRSET